MLPGVTSHAEHMAGSNGCRITRGNTADLDSDQPLMRGAVAALRGTRRPGARRPSVSQKSVI